MPMIRARKAGGQRGGAVLVLLLLFVVAAAACAFFLFGKPAPEPVSEPAKPVITSAVLKEELRYVQDLVSLEYNYTNADKAAYPGHVLLGREVPLTGKSFIVSYDGVIRYGVDLSGVEPVVDEEARRVTVTVPPAKIISHEIPEESYQTLDERDGLFNPVRIEDDAAFRAEQKEKMERKGEELGMPRKAQEQAGNTIRALFSALPALDDYEIVIEYADPAA